MYYACQIKHYNINFNESSRHNFVDYSSYWSKSIINIISVPFSVKNNTIC